MIQQYVFSIDGNYYSYYNVGVNNESVSVVRDIAWTVFDMARRHSDKMRYTQAQGDKPVDMTEMMRPRDRFLSRFRHFQIYHSLF